MILIFRETQIVKIVSFQLHTGILNQGVNLNQDF